MNTKLKTYVIENVKFKPKAGVGEPEFLAAMKGLDLFARKQPGFIGRELSKSKDGVWLDHVQWADMASATNAMEKSYESEECAPAFALIDEQSVEVTHLETVHIVKAAGNE